MGNKAPEQASPLTEPPPAGGERRVGRGRLFLLKAALGSGLFTGYFPVAPATVTSLFVLVPAWFLRPRPFWHAAVAVAVFFIGVPIATDLERAWGRDPGRVTIDEVVGTLVTFIALPPLTAWTMALGFLTWRFFDIVKLPFIDRSQRLPGGWGIMIDDVLAGICANLTMQLVLRLGPALVPGLRPWLCA
jgi:phosphatidylglycerophosphatase A